MEVSPSQAEIASKPLPIVVQILDDRNTADDTAVRCSLDRIRLFDSKEPSAHRLFDASCVTVTPDYQVEASLSLAEEFDDGKSYVQLNVRENQFPEQEEYWPNSETLAWHSEVRFRG